MDNIKSDSYFVDLIKSDIYKILEYIKNVSFDDFMKDTKTVDATMFRLQQMIEHIKEISNGFKQKHSEIPWVDIVGFRNRIVHEYGKIDYTTVYEIITVNIYQLKELFQNNV